MEENGIKIEEHMENMEENIEEWIGHIEDNIERIVKILQNTKENILKVDDVGQGSHDDSSHVENPSMNKHALRGSDSNIGSTQGWST